MNETWEEPKEEDGLTLGPDEALQRELKKSKTLEKLQIEKSDLANTNQQLKERLTKLGKAAASHEIKDTSSSNTLVFTLVLGLLVLLWFVARN